MDRFNNLPSLRSFFFSFFFLHGACRNPVVLTQTLTYVAYFFAILGIPLGCTVRHTLHCSSIGLLSFLPSYFCLCSDFISTFRFISMVTWSRWCTHPNRSSLSRPAGAVRFDQHQQHFTTHLNIPLLLAVFHLVARNRPVINKIKMHDPLQYTPRKWYCSCSFENIPQWHKESLESFERKDSGFVHHLGS